MPLLDNILGNQQAPQQRQPLQPQRPAVADTRQPFTFDPANSQQDQQALIDAVGMAEMLLKSKDDEKLKQAWPGVVTALKKVKPGIEQVLRPDSPPSRQELRQFLGGTLGQAPTEEEINPEKAKADFLQYWNPEQDTQGLDPQEMSLLEGLTTDAPLTREQQATMKRIQDNDLGPAAIEEEEEEEVAPSFIGLSSTVKNQVQKELTSVNNTLQDAVDLYENFDSDFFTYAGKLKNKALGIGEKAGITLSPKNQEELYNYRQQNERLEQIFNQYRKMITGAQASEKELEKLKKATLNPDLSPTEARASLDRLMSSLLRDEIVYKRMLSKGFVPDVTLDKGKYGRVFESEKAKIANEIDIYRDQLRAANPKRKITTLDALRYKRLQESRQE